MWIIIISLKGVANKVITIVPPAEDGFNAPVNTDFKPFSG